MMLTFFSVYPNSDYPEQDMLNYYFNENCNLLNEKYNTLVEWQRYNGISSIENRIYHYSNKSIDIGIFDEYTNLFFLYFTKTPWCDDNFMRRIFSVYSVMYKAGFECSQNHTYGSADEGFNNIDLKDLLYQL